MMGSLEAPSSKPALELRKNLTLSFPAHDYPAQQIYLQGGKHNCKGGQTGPGENSEHTGERNWTWRPTVWSWRPQL